jgi:hypothetical protein
MSYIDDINNEVEQMTPDNGFNVCSFDDFENELTILGHFETMEEAEEYAVNFGDQTIYIYGGEEDGEEPSAGEGIDISQQKGHNIDRYLEKALDDFEKGINSPNEEYERKNYGGEGYSGSQGEPHVWKTQSMLDSIVAKSIGKEKEEEIDKLFDKGFDLDTLMTKVAEILAKKAGKKLGLENVNKDGITCEKCGRYFDPNSDFMMTDYNKHIKTHRADEGGKGSGKRGHQKWMISGEAGDECENCMMITDKNESGNCEICGA